MGVTGSEEGIEVNGVMWAVWGRRLVFPSSLSSRKLNEGSISVRRLSSFEPATPVDLFLDRANLLADDAFEVELEGSATLRCRISKTLSRLVILFLAEIDPVLEVNFGGRNNEVFICACKRTAWHSSKKTSCRLWSTILR